ncbi:AbrB/MazE/SpoVT family DNA-binding domain-containing protein [Halobacillus sp. BAB-2008]|uniref:AbrB/MazE/SpoVT family DNA-binding domain-containing protein n=1 Tax=Halobacillus sp. BAB-2008 TaxID=1246484 RepID=UPI0002A4FBD6|nr:AbrB/MazE/SpoVT family DNA-binding domain-containing protein [Halobacillus sp. BAB-2008]ELK47213.1 SpoVT/AbrB domain-containing protein [Halobacillus sp. BAB-2008]
MKALGIVRKLDELGRVVIPKEVRDSQGWQPGQPLEMFMDGESMVLSAYGKAQEKEDVLEELRSLKGELSGEAKERIKQVIAYVEK